MNGFVEAMQSAGISPPQDIQADGLLHRCRVEGDKPKSKNGWYVLHDDPPAGAFGNWKSGLSEKWSSAERHTLTSEEKARYRANMEAQKKQREAEQARVHAECREKSKSIWEQAKPAPADHPYLLKKQVKPHGLREYKNSLVIPVRDGRGVLHGLQFISAEGSKKFMTGTAKRGHYFSIGGKPSSVIYLAEGYATAVTIHAATRQPVAVAFDSGNLKLVAKTLREKFPSLKIVVCGDSDSKPDGNNVGREKAEAAALSVGGNSGRERGLRLQRSCSSCRP